MDPFDFDDFIDDYNDINGQITKISLSDNEKKITNIMDNPEIPSIPNLLHMGNTPNGSDEENNDSEVETEFNDDNKDILSISKTKQPKKKQQHLSRRKKESRASRARRLQMANKTTISSRLNRTTKEPNAHNEGALVYLFVNEQDQAEIAVFRKLCMKYGLQAWDQMVSYIPWRNRATLRTALCRLLMKQALSEYDGIKADPVRIQNDNKARLTNNNDFVFKAGLFVNQQWDRTHEEWEELRQQNYEEYNISDDEAERIEIPNIVSLEYMKQLCDNRRQSLLLVRASILNEIARRKAIREKGVPQQRVDLRLEDLVINPSETLNLPAYENPLSVDHNPLSFYFDFDK